ncbi:hypothetical protein CR513_45958, partial [Mucuna pruriens]
MNVPKNVEEYYKEMEVTFIRAQIVESHKTTMARFFNGLNRDIHDIIKLHDYTSISTLVHQAFKVESQLRRHGKKSYPTTSTNQKGKERRKEKLLRRDKSPKKGVHPLKATKKSRCTKPVMSNELVLGFRGIVFTFEARGKMQPIMHIKNCPSLL